MNNELTDEYLLKKVKESALEVRNHSHFDSNEHKNAASIRLLCEVVENLLTRINELEEMLKEQ